MNIGILGTGAVGDAIGTKLIQLGHSVLMGSRTANNEKAVAWVQKNGTKAKAGTFADAAHFATEVIFNCTSGVGSLDALRSAGAENLNGKILIDISNPLDFSKGFPPSLTVSNTDSLGEQNQRAFPELKVVKAFNTLSNPLMVNPSLVNNGDHTLPICGNDETAKAKVISLLNTFGWKSENILDLGDITAARGTEAFLLLWVRMFGKFQTPMFQFKIVK
jgi:8-hydroxy-5-deazaflavin:NADPH oxidoreductase